MVPTEWHRRPTQVARDQSPRTRDSELGMKTRAQDRDWSTILVVGGVIDQLQIRGEMNILRDGNVIICLDDLLVTSMQ